MVISAPPFTSYVALGKLLNLPEPLVPHLWDGNNNTCLTGLLWGLNKVITTLEHSKVPVSIFPITPAPGMN